jgi:hypothetical protein
MNTAPVSKPELFSERLCKWQGKQSNAAAAGALGIPMRSYLKYKYGQRTPGPARLGRVEIERRMKMAKPNWEQQPVPK